MPRHPTVPVVPSTHCIKGAPLELNWPLDKQNQSSSFQVLLSICSLLCDPNPDDPLVPEIARLFACFGRHWFIQSVFHSGFVIGCTRQTRTSTTSVHGSGPGSTPCERELERMEHIWSKQSVVAVLCNWLQLSWAIRTWWNRNSVKYNKIGKEP